MKNIATLLSAIVLLFAACVDPDEQPSEPTTLPTTQLNTLSATLLTVKYSRPHTSDVFIIASKSDGTLLDSKRLSNGTTTTLVTNEIGIKEFTATIVTTDSISGYNKLHSFYATPTGGTWWVYPLEQNPVTGSAELVIEGTGTVGPPIYLTGANAGAILDGSSGNSMKINYELHQNATEVPVLTIYRSLLDNQVRFHYDDALPAEQTTTVQHDSLPIIESPTTIDFGMGSINLSFISGIVQTPNDDRARLLISWVTDPTTQTTEHYIPEGIFEEYLLYVGGKLPNSEREFSSYIYADAPVTSFEYPDFNADIAFVDNGFNFTTASDFNHFYLEYLNEKGAQWTVYSAAHPNGEFRFPTLPSILLDNYPELSAPLNYVKARYIRYEPARPTSDYYQYLFPEAGTQEPFYYREDILK